MAQCDSCVYNVYDYDDECYYCEVDMDEDDAARLMQGHYKECPYYQNDDEYAVVRHQMQHISFVQFTNKVCGADLLQAEAKQ